MHTIWTNVNLDYEDWRGELEHYYPLLSEDERKEKMYEFNDDYLNDERINLNHILDDPIIVIADLGLWNGRRVGYKEIASGNISDCLYSNTEYADWYVDDDGEFRCDAMHHDGTNHYVYRTYRSDAPEHLRERLKEKLYDGTATEEDIDRVTRKIGIDIANIYGFELKKEAV